MRRQRLLLAQVASLIFGRQLYHSRRWINTQAVRFHVENNSMKEFMELLESDNDSGIVYRPTCNRLSMHSYANQYCIAKLDNR